MDVFEQIERRGNEERWNALDENDIIILLADRLRTVKEDNFSVVFSEIDKELQLRPGSAKEHIEAAAQDAELTIVRKGATRISLRRQNEFSF